MADTSEGEESGDEGSIYCCMHTCDKKSKLVKLTDKSYAKFKDCSLRWRELNCPESLIAATFLENDHDDRDDDDRNPPPSGSGDTSRGSTRGRPRGGRVR